MTEMVDMMNTFLRSQQQCCRNHLSNGLARLGDQPMSFDKMFTTYSQLPQITAQSKAANAGKQPFWASQSGR